MVGDKTVTLRTTLGDISRGVCGSRAHCILANTIDRQFGLGGQGYIRVDATGWGVTIDGWRYRYLQPRKAMTYLRRFDHIGAKKGVDVAREMTETAVFKCTLRDVTAAAPKATQARKDQINKLRRKRDARDRAAGVYQPKQARYVGV